MVDRVGNGPGYGYPQINEKKVNTGVAGTGEKFQLDYGKEGAIYEPGSESLKRQETGKTGASNTTTSSRTAEDGVRLTLSTDALDNQNTAKNENASSDSIFDKLTGIVNALIDRVKKFVSSIWYDEPKEIAPTESPQVEKPKTQFEKAKAEAEAFLASDEGKKAARNSDLLTYYDKRGTVVQVSPSDRQRILYGDKNQIEV